MPQPAANLNSDNVHARGNEQLGLSVETLRERHLVSKT